MHFTVGLYSRTVETNDWALLMAVKSAPDFVFCKVEADLLRPKSSGDPDAETGVTGCAEER